MPRKLPTPEYDTPSIRAKAIKRYEEVYEPAYRTRIESHPALEVGLRELARVEVQLEFVDIELEKKQAEGGSAFLAKESSKAPHWDPLIKLQVELRKQQGKYMERLSLSIGKQQTLKAESNTKLDQLAAKMR